MPVIILPVVDDAFVNSAAPDTNSGGDVIRAGVGDVIHSYIRFNIVNKLPKGIYVSKAELKYVSRTGDAGSIGQFQVVANVSPWSQGIITHNNRPTGVGVESVDHTFVNAAPQSEVTNVLDEVREILANSYQSEFRFRALLNTITLEAKENATPSNRPFLEVTYSGVPSIGEFNNRSMVPDMNRRIL